MSLVPNPDPSRFPVRQKRCDACLFSAARLVSEQRKSLILRECDAKHTAFQCHKATLLGQYIVCRGFYDEHDSLVVGLAKLLNVVDFVMEDDTHVKAK